MIDALPTLTPVLAQLDRLVADVAPLPSPPLWERVLFESPLLGTATLAALGLVVGFALRSQGKPKPGALVAIGGLVLGGLVWLTAGLVRTDREVLIERTDTLISAVAEVDGAALRRLVTDRVRLDAGGFAGVTGREELISTAEARLRGNYEPERYDVKEIQAVVDGPVTARSQVSIVVDVPLASNVGSVWEIDWRRNDEGQWLANEVELKWAPFMGR